MFMLSAPVKLVGFYIQYLLPISAHIHIIYGSITQSQSIYGTSNWKMMAEFDKSYKDKPPLSGESVCIRVMLPY